MLGVTILSANLATEIQETESFLLKSRHLKEKTSKTYQLEIRSLSCLGKMSQLLNRKRRKPKREQEKKRQRMLQRSHKTRRDNQWWIISSRKIILKTIGSFTNKKIRTSSIVSHTREISPHSLRCNPFPALENLKRLGASLSKMILLRKTIILETQIVRTEMPFPQAISSWKSWMKGQQGHSSSFIESIILIVIIEVTGPRIMRAR